MAINVSFNGATIYQPGSYSQTQIDLGGGFPLGPAGLIAVIGEADAGTPGYLVPNIAQNNFTANQVPQIVSEYRSGPIADVASMLFSPAADAAIPSGAQTVWFYKTNHSTQAQLVLANAYGTVPALEYGIGGNMITQTVTSVGETPATTASTAPFNESLIAVGDNFVLNVNGGAANTFTFATAPTSTATLATILATAGNWSGGLPANMTITVGGTTGASTVTFTMTAAPTQYTLGFGRSFELAAGSPNALTKMDLLAGMYTASVEPSVMLVVNQTRDNIQESATVGGDILLALGRTSAGGVTAATVTISATMITLTQTGGTPASYALPLSSYTTINQLAASINLLPGWSASVPNSQLGQNSPADLDKVTGVGAFTEAGQPARLKQDASEVAAFFASSNIVSMLNQATVGLPQALSQTLLSGGVRGASTTLDVINALTAFQAFHVNSVLPLFSRDATADIADGLTDAGSTYTIAGIHQAVKTHLSLMATTKQKSERQGYLSYKNTYALSKTQAGILADARIQLAIQDTRNINAQGNVLWFQPWSLAALLAGSRGGAPIGEPLTFKYMNCSGIRQTGQAMTTPDANIVIDFNPNNDADDAIINGLTFLQAPQTGGFRVELDNTTYGVDDNWVFNRANVLYAADILAYNFRTTMENAFIGHKNTVSVKDIAGVATSILTTFLGQGITVSTSDAPQGFKNLVVTLNGNTITIGVTVKLVEGIDFILSTITLERATATSP
jgi:hypothetical protein